MAPDPQALERIRRKLRLDTPLIAVYDAEPGEGFEPTIDVKGRGCCFHYYKQWLAGKTLVFRKGKGDFRNPDCGCPGAQTAFGLNKTYPPFMANFLTDGKGAPMGEGLKASPEIAQKFIDESAKLDPKHDSVLVGPLRLDRWEEVRSATFLVDPDRLAGVLTLATYWSMNKTEAVAPFSSGCGLMWRSLHEFDEDKVIIGCTDLAMRRYIPPEIMSITVSPARLERMTQAPEGSFLDKDWWNELMDKRGL
jgi:hypothetical protein